MMTEKPNTPLDVPEGCAPGAYRLYRAYFVANYLDGDDGGVLTVKSAALADDIAEMFSDEHWRETWNDALFQSVRNWDHEAS